MPKRLKIQRRGKAKPKYKSPTHRWRSRVNIPSTAGEASVVDIVHGVGRSAPLMKLRMGDKEFHLPAPEGIRVGDVVSIGDKIIRPGNVVELSLIPEGTRVYNIELNPGDGGRFVRTSGSSARIVAKEAGSVVVQMPSKAIKRLHPRCRAVIGIIAGAGRTEKPFLKAGKKHHAVKRGSKVWPKVAGVAMNPVDHPFGGGGRSGRKQKVISKRMPAGKKVGSIGARRTGKRRR
jgi:large subunit ribosomal protein L2